MIDFLIVATFDEDIDVRIAAICELGAFTSNPKVIERLKGCLNDMSKSSLSKITVNAIVSRVLGNFQKNEVKSPPLLDDTITSKPRKSSDIVKARLLNVKHKRIVTAHDTASQSDLSSLKDNDQMLLDQSHSINSASEPLSVILSHLRNGNWNNTTTAARDLKEYVKKSGVKTSSNTINQILETLNDDNWVIRWTSIESLGWTRNIQVVPHLIRTLTDPNWKIRIAAIRALAEIGDKSSVQSISNLITDSNPVVREAAAEALGTLGGAIALQVLESSVLDEEDFVRLAVMESLGKLRHPDATKSLLSGLQDNSEHVRWAAANGLLGISDPLLVNSLIPSLKDTSGPYWEQKRICDVIIDILKQIDSLDAEIAINEWRNNQTH